MFLASEKNTIPHIEVPIIRTASSWVEIDTKALEHNLRGYKKIVSPALLAPVIKSNAYGHGLELVAKICERHDAVAMMCVVSLNEALYLRSIGIAKPLLVLSIVQGDLAQAIAQSIDLVVYDLGMLVELNEIGKRLKQKARVHLKVDTGLSRLGVYGDEVLELLQQVRSLPFISIRGIFTHFAESESADQTFTNEQLARFNLLMTKTDALGIEIPLKHTTCSAAVTANRPSHQTLVRVGIGIYGLWPSEANKCITQQQYPAFSLKPVMSWKTSIIQIKDIPAGSTVGYDRTHRVHRQSRIAIIPIGYWDGYDRRLSNKGSVLINNQLAPVVGRIAMNLSMIDITGLTVSINDDVTLLGNHPGVTADAIAQHCQTINYEIVTRINPLLPRINKE